MQSLCRSNNILHTIGPLTLRHALKTKLGASLWLDNKQYSTNFQFELLIWCPTRMFFVDCSNQSFFLQWPLCTPPSLLLCFCSCLVVRRLTFWMETNCCCRQGFHASSSFVFVLTLTDRTALVVVLVRWRCFDFDWITHSDSCEWLGVGGSSRRNDYGYMNGCGLTVCLYILGWFVVL